MAMVAVNNNLLTTPENSFLLWLIFLRKSAVAR